MSNKKSVQNGGKVKTILGIESSCDETGCAIVTDSGEILSSVIWSQYDEHRRFGGVVPEIAARAHLEKIDVLINETMKKAGKDFADLDAIAVAGGPGLIGGVLVGVMTAKAIALAHDLPFVAVNHLEGHALTVRLTEKHVTFPYLLLLASGGHCQILIVEGVGKYKKLGATIDDSAGEAFDKVAKMLDIGYPGGPNVEKRAREGDMKKTKFPVPLRGKPGCDFSFSGLKTSVRVYIERHQPLSDQDKNDICASFQYAVAKQIEDRLNKAVKIFKDMYPDGKDLVVSGGVAANRFIRQTMDEVAKKNGMIFSAPPIQYCTDNGVMIAWGGMERFKLGLTDPFDFKARPRWPLDLNS